MNGAIRIRDETGGDWDAVARLNRDAFGDEVEVAIISRLRQAGLIETALVATADSAIVGHIVLSRLPTEMDDRPVRALALAPMAVAPEWQRRGVGAALIRAAIDRAKKAGAEAILVLGHPAYYPRFGFAARLAEKLAAPFSGEGFMALELVSGALNGTRGAVDYPAAFFGTEKTSG